MKTIVRFLLLLGFLLTVLCTEFDWFERIENDRLRVIGVTYAPSADFAPGDTLVGKVYFAGDTVSSVDNFSIAYRHQYDKNDIFPDERKIALIDSTLWFPDSMQFRYKIPEDVFMKEYLQGGADSNRVKSVYDQVTALKQGGPALMQTIGEDSLEKLASAINRIYAQPSIFFHAKSVNGVDLKVRSEIIIRYNSLFSGYLPINHNPVIKWIGIYKVPAKKSKTFSPDSNRIEPDSNCSLTYLYNEYDSLNISDTVAIDTGYDYFLTCTDGIDLRVDGNGDTVGDTTCDMIETGADFPSIVPEIYNYEWFFQNVDDIDEVKDSLLMFSYENSGPGYIQLKLPVFTAMKHFKIWVVIHDEAPGQWNRPQGYAVRSVEGVFKYTDAYSKSVK